MKLHQWQPFIHLIAGSGPQRGLLKLQERALNCSDCAKELSLCQCPDGSRGIFSIYLPLSHGKLECVSVCVGRGGPELCSLAPAMSVPRRFPGSKSAELVTAEAMKRPWQMWACSLILYEYWICFFFRGRVALCLCCCLLFITCRVYTILEWGVVNKSCKVASWRYILAGGIQERTRKQKGSVGAMKTNPCCRPWKSFGNMF